MLNCFSNKAYIAGLEDDNDDVLQTYREGDLAELLKEGGPIDHVDIDHMLRVLECIKVHESGTFEVCFLEGTVIEVNKKEG